MSYKTIYCLSDNTKKAHQAYLTLKKKYKLTDTVEKADVILVLGGDGFMLHVLHKYMELGIPIYGMNRGTVGFLMNDYNNKNLTQRLNNAKPQILYPLKMDTRTVYGKKHKALAINEVSLLRETRQAASLEVSIDGKVRIPEMSCDGILVSTPAGSTAYNLSVHGPIIPLGSDILALTPISPFRPRRWRGALLAHNRVVRIKVLNPKKRPVSAVADFTEIRDVELVEISEDRTKKIQLLFDQDHSLEDRIISEQFIA